MDPLDLLWDDLPADQSSPPNAVRESATGYGAPVPYFADTAHGIRLYQGDALELLRRARAETFDLIFADPPYFLSNDGITCQNGKMVSVNKGMWDHAETFEAIHEFNTEWLKECRRLLKPNGTIWVSGTSHNIHSVGFAMQTLGYKILNDITWQKTAPPPNLACRYFTHATETIIWARKNAKARHLFHYDEMKAENGGKQMLSVWRMSAPEKWEKRYGKHPTQKPEALLDRIVRAASNPGDMVLDPFCGSGTTGVVAARLGRRFWGLERDCSFLALAATRITDELGTAQVLFVFNMIKTPHSPQKRWREIVVDAVKRLGGEATLQEINTIVASHPRVCDCPTWRATVRREVRHSRELEPLRRGTYRLTL